MSLSCRNGEGMDTLVNFNFDELHLPHLLEDACENQEKTHVKVFCRMASVINTLVVVIVTNMCSRGS